MRRGVLGSVHEKAITKRWESPGHRAFRRRVIDLVFPPCFDGGGCPMTESGE